MSEQPAVIPVPPHRDEYCRCGHTREYHAFGLNECAWVYPAWTCPARCKKWRPSNQVPVPTVEGKDG